MHCYGMSDNRAAKLKVFAAFALPTLQLSICLRTSQYNTNHVGVVTTALSKVSSQKLTIKLRAFNRGSTEPP